MRSVISLLLIAMLLPSVQAWALQESYTAQADSDFFWGGTRQRNLNDARGNAKSRAIALCRKAGGHEQIQYVMSDETGVTYSDERCKHRVFVGSDEYLCWATATVKCGLEEYTGPHEKRPTLDCNGDGTGDLEIKKVKLRGNEKHPAATIRVLYPGGKESTMNISPDMYANSLKQKKYYKSQLEKYKEYHQKNALEGWQHDSQYKRLAGQKSDMEKFLCEGLKRQGPLLLQKLKGKIHSILKRDLQECLDKARTPAEKKDCYPKFKEANPGGVRG